MRTVLALLLVAGSARAELSLGGASWRVTSIAPAGSMPWAVTTSPDGRQVYVTHVGYRGRDNVWRYAAATLAVEARARFPGHAVEAALTADGRTLYVTNSRRHVVMVLDAQTLAVRRTLPAGKTPKDLALAPGGGTLYTADWSSGTLSAIDVASASVVSIPVGRHARGVALSRDGTYAYVALMGGRQVAFVDLRARRVVRRIDACRRPRGLAVTADGQVLVTCNGEGRVVVLDEATGAVTRRVRVGRGPKTIALTRDGRFALTADERSNTMSIIDLDTWEVARLPIPAKKPCGLYVAPDDRTIYLTARGSGDLVVVERR